MRPIFYDYQPSNPKFAHYARLSQGLGLLLIGITSALMAFAPRTPGPGLWTALGLGIGLELVFWGALNLKTYWKQLSPWGLRLLQTRDRWFPLYLFFTRYAFIATLLTVLWLALAELGFPVRAWHHILFVTVVLILPLSRLAREMAGADPPPRLWALENGCHLVNAILITVIIASILHSVVKSQAAPYGTETDPLVLIIWVLALLAIAAALFVYLGRALRLRKPGHPSRPGAPPGNAEQF